MIKNIFAEVGDEEVVEAVVVVVTDTNTLSPAGMDQTGLHCDVAKRTVAIVFEQMRVRLLAFWKTFQPPSVHQKNIQPAVVVIVIESDAATCSLKQIFILVFATEDGFRVQTGLFADVREVDAQLRKPRDGSQTLRVAC